MNKQPLIFFFVSTIVLLATVLAGADPEPQWYTLQIGSYQSEKDAQVIFNAVHRELPAAALPNLRIEQISPYYTVRIGKFSSQEEAEALAKSFRASPYKPAIMRAYVRSERILAGITTDAPPTSANQKESEPARQFSLPVPTTPDQPSEPLFFTIQLNSYPTAKEALILFGQMAEKLPPHLRQTLRVEKISASYTVRVGLAPGRQELKELFTETQKFVANPLILQAYLRASRVVKSYTAAPAQAPAPAATPPPAPETIPMVERLDDTPTQAAQKPAPVAPPEPSSRPPTPTPAKAEPFMAQPAALSPKESPAALTPVVPAGPQPGTPEFQAQILAKYLNTTQAERDKERKSAQAKADLTAANPNCLTGDCHASLAAPTPGHYPAKTARCEACHLPQAEAPPANGHSKFQLAAQGAALCGRCHAEVSKGKVAHQPTAAGDCLHCHNPHGTENPALLAVGQTGQQKLCLECHDEKIVAAKYQHGPVGLGACTYCHSPHSSEQPSLLRDKVEALCLSCHSDFRKSLAESAHIHTPLKKQGCLTCHSAHGGPFPHLLPEKGQTFCFTCHTELEAKVTKARSKHAALSLDGQCGTCHLPHFSEVKFLLRKNEKTLCYSCHGNNVSMPPFKPTNMEKQIEGKEYIHAPVAAGECSSCHSPHGSANLKLLLEKYPASFYAPYEPEQYSLCFICHETELLTAVDTTSKTAFRNGSKNLHFLHVGLERKGRTCQACHAVHASDGPKLINRTGAPFGSWTMSVDFFVTKNGGSCTPSCHREMNYDRDKPVDYKKKDTSFGKYFIDYKSIK